jgi:hypothetical protein
VKYLVNLSEVLRKVEDEIVGPIRLQRLRPRQTSLIRLNRAISNAAYPKQRPSQLPGLRLATSTSLQCLLQDDIEVTGVAKVLKG